MKIALILLAAGDSRRFGSNKLLHKIGGRPMFQYMLEKLARTAEKENTKERGRHSSGRLDREHWHGTGAMPEKPDELILSLTVVTQYEKIGETAKALGAMVCYNPRPWEGISSSLKIGLQANPEVDFALFAVADQPRLTEKTLDGILHLALTSGKGMACAVYGEKSGNPCIFSKKYFPELLSLTGDRGGKKILTAHPDDVALWQVSDMAELEDVDTVNQLYGFQKECPDICSDNFERV